MGNREWINRKPVAEALEATGIQMRKGDERTKRDDV
jgi:hypothetical protein